MPRITVLIPTHEHASTLPYAVRSVQAQGIDDVEILICGDGATDAVRAEASGLQRADPRIRFFDLPKGPRHGELNRDYVLRQATGGIVCYQSDDDLWLPGHIEACEEALADADFVAGTHFEVRLDDQPRFFSLIWGSDISSSPGWNGVPTGSALGQTTLGSPSPLTGVTPILGFPKVGQRPRPNARRISSCGINSPGSPGVA
jgi:glycosyltransferase involved in cell wall biosynthesis